MKEPTVLFEDEQIVVIDKPSGMIMHTDGKHDYPELDEWLRKKYGEIFLVHRIDRETSGVMVVAKTSLALESLKNQFKNREVKKTYRAFVYGKLPERGVIEKPIGSARGGLGPRSARRPYGVLRDAVTVYRRIATGEGVSCAEVFPKTGRTHQIRVHFASLQHPVLYDPLYPAKRPPELGFKRLALHAHSLVFTHPVTGAEMSFEAPLPADFIAAEKEMYNASF